MARVLIAMGSNLGDRAANLAEASKRFGEQAQIRSESRMYETEPWGVTNQPRFLNRVLEAETALDPARLLACVKSIEAEMGREQTVRYGPRLIDLDILFYGGEIVSLPGLEIPHPRLSERRFVLVPLAEIAPDLVHPLIGLSVRALLARLPEDGSVRLYEPRAQ